MKNVLVHFADGFEEIEAITPVDVLRRAGFNVIMVSVNGNNQVKSSRGVTVIVDKLIEDIDYQTADMIILPGGMPGSKNLDNHEGLKAHIIDFNNKGKYLAAICAAPMVFGHLGILEGKNATCYPGIEKELLGAFYTGADVEVAGNIITSKGAGTALQFSFKLVELLDCKQKADEIKEQMMA